MLEKSMSKTVLNNHRDKFWKLSR